MLLARFLLKVGLELLAGDKIENPYASHYDAARACSRHGVGRSAWEAGYGQYPRRSDLITNVRYDSLGRLETRQIYQYSIGAMASGDRILSFVFIDHCFACNLSRPSLAEYITGFNKINEFRMTRLE
jgi:hypothetical protein